MKLIIMFLIGVAIIIAVPNLLHQCDGEKHWETYHGKLIGLYIDVDTCCHCDTRLKLEGEGWVYTYDCDESLSDVLKINETYTIHTRPHAEEYAATCCGCFWVEAIDYIEDEDGNVVYGWKWW